RHRYAGRDFRGHGRRPRHPGADQAARPLERHRARQSQGAAKKREHDMNTVIFRTAAPVLTALMLVFSVFVLLRGHNEPGGGFIGGLIGASGILIYSIAMGVDATRKALRVHPITLAGLGVVLAAISGFISLALEVPFLTGLWWIFEV